MPAHRHSRCASPTQWEQAHDAVTRRIDTRREGQESAQRGQPGEECVHQLEGKPPIVAIGPSIVSEKP